MKLRIVRAALLLFALMLTGCQSKGYGQVIEDNWDISIPEDYELLYEASSDLGFHGDNERYHVFAYSESSELADIVTWLDDATINARVAEILNGLKVEEKYRPTARSGLKRYTFRKEGSSRMYWYFDAVNGLLYVVEDFF